MTTPVSDMRTLLDFVNGDEKLQAFVGKVAEVQDLPAKAPSNVALHIVQDIGDEHWDKFRVPYSKQKDNEDGYGKPVGENARTNYKWDYYKYGDVSGSWYIDFVDGTKAGQEINKVREVLDKANTHEGKNEVLVVIDGTVLDVLKMQPQQRESFKTMFDQRRSRMAAVWRKAVQIIMLWQEIEQRMGQKYDDQGNMTELGKVFVSWVYLNPQNPSEGLSPSKNTIRIEAILQEDVKVKQGDKEVVVRKAGMPSGDYRDMTTSTFLNLSVDEAMTKGGTYIALRDSKRKKADTTAAGQGDTGDKSKSKITAAILPSVLSEFRLFTEHDGSKTAFRTALAAMKGDALQAVAYDMVEALNFLNDIVTKDMLKAHDDYVKNADTKREAEIAAKLALEADKTKNAA